MGFFTASRLNKMKTYFRDGDYEKAIALADKINPTEIRTAYDLSMMADIYMTAGRYGAARRVFAEMYKRNKTVRVCKQLITLNLKLKNVKQAIYYVKELSILDNEDYERFVFQYQIGKMLRQPDVYLIECLKRVREADYIDKWALELAKLFYKTGKTEECIAECQNIKLWFPETDFAAKADMLLNACRAGATYENTVAGGNAQEPEPRNAAGEARSEAGIDSTYPGNEAGTYDAYPETEVGTDGIYPGNEAGTYGTYPEGETGTYDAYPETGEDDDAASEEAYTDEAYFEEDGSEIGISEYDEYADEGNGGLPYDEYAGEEAGEPEYGEYADGEAGEPEHDNFNPDFDDEEEEEIDDSRSYSVRRTTAGAPSMTEISADEDEVFFDLSDSVKNIMDEESEQKGGSEPEEREDIATTLVNDALTAEIMNALREQEKSGSIGDKDAVDESILKMLNEE